MTLLHKLRAWFLFRSARKIRSRAVTEYRQAMRQAHRVERHATRSRRLSTGLKFASKGMVAVKLSEPSTGLQSAIRSTVSQLPKMIAL